MKCDFCGKEHTRKRFCSNKCKDDWHNRARARLVVKVVKKCEYCGKAHKRKRFCSNKCKDAWHNRERFGNIQFNATSFHDDDDDFDYATGWDEDCWVGDDSGVTVLA